MNPSKVTLQIFTEPVFTYFFADHETTALAVGQNLNNDMWHLVKLSRRGRKFAFSVDELSATGKNTNKDEKCASIKIFLHG